MSNAFIALARTMICVMTQNSAENGPHSNTLQRWAGYAICISQMSLCNKHSKHNLLAPDSASKRCGLGSSELMYLSCLGSFRPLQSACESWRVDWPWVALSMSGFWLGWISYVSSAGSLKLFHMATEFQNIHSKSLEEPFSSFCMNHAC